MKVLREHRDGIAFAAGIGLPIVVSRSWFPSEASSRSIGTASLRRSRSTAPGTTRTA